jgi:hypothetical protein
MKRVAVVVLAMAAMAPTVAEAQCPLGATCFFGTDVTGSASTRATNVNALNARNAFFTNLIGVGTETFETIADNTTNPSLVFPGAGTASLTGGGSVLTQGPGTEGNGRFPVSGLKFYEATSAAGGGTTFSIAFLNPVAAFGFYGIDIGEFGSQLSLLFTLVGGGTQTWSLPYVATNGQNTLRDGSLLYAGFINTTGFTSVAFLGTNSSDVFGFDDMTVGSIQQVQPPSVVPEPSTVLLMSVGLVAVAALMRRRRRA